ncbi:hypothetical protein [Chamaesiphon sp. VAR_48_metabat_135_sub]|uniref:WD40 repeat domain-containing protein n=1 Tax=Chamaesiphon sp. VAR_48_metabat_135_sub TaxID=2964699 RepID=UPI00286A22C8|nr:hypothetical protein [Chamaesiphon sp. VAR_48_metabat_135_sub]
MKIPNLANEEEPTEQPILELSATTQLSDYVSAIAWSPIGNTLAAACCNGEVHLIKSFVGRALCPPTNNSIDALAFSHDGKWLAAGGLDGNIRHLAWADLPPSANFPPFLAASTRELVTVWVKSPLDWESWVLELSSGNVIDVAFQPKSGVLASLAEDGWIVLWQAAVEAVQVLDGAEEGFCCLGWHPTGCRLAAGGRQGELFVWSVCGRS